MPRRTTHISTRPRCATVEEARARYAESRRDHFAWATYIGEVERIRGHK